jgi:hypothetical protein
VCKDDLPRAAGPFAAGGGGNRNHPVFVHNDLPVSIGQGCVGDIDFLVGFIRFTNVLTNGGQDVACRRLRGEMLLFSR